jgi:alpha-mannosidase
MKSSLSRRKFINRTVAGSAFVAFGPVIKMVSNDQQEEIKWSEDASKYRFHLIGQAHIDPVWLWPWPEGIAVVHSTFRSALDRMNETPDFTFTASSAQFYQWIAENDPAMLEEIRKRVEEGRWCIAGGWWVEPDVNIPCGESLVRQGLYGQMTFQRLLGRRAKVAFNPDSFGHSGTLPQIIKLQGMDNYVFMRPGPKEKRIPADLFWWEGPDGSTVLVYRIPISYTDTGSVRNRIQKVMEQFRGEPFSTFMSYYGAGDHGGGATRENIASIKEIQTEEGAPVLIFSTPEKYFKEIRSDKNLKLPSLRDDLQHHAVGCYTAESEIKKGNRSAETALITAEKIAAVGSAVWDFKYPKQEFTSAWQRVLFLQFHDSLAGTSVPEHSQTARDGFGSARDTASQAVYMAVQKLEWGIPAEDPASQYLLAFNPHSWEISANLEYDFNWDQKKQSVAEDEKGTALVHQWTAGTTEAGSRRRVIVRTSVPAFGYRQIRIREGNSTGATLTVKATDKSIENEFLKLTISPEGTIGIFDKKAGREVFAGGATGCRAVIINDPSDTWSHDIKSFPDEIGAFGSPVTRIIENGPLRSMIRATTTYGSSKLTVDWILHSAQRNLEARISLDWHEHLKMIKFSFPLNGEQSAATYEVPYGFISRSANGDENPGQRWIDITGTVENRNYGFAVINDAKYGYSVNGNDLRISVARSAVYAHHIPRVLDMNADHIWQDQGIQTFRMMIVPHDSALQEAHIARIAEEFSAQPVLIYQGIHGGRLPKADSFLEADAENIIISSVKLAEENEDMIFRCVETDGKQTSARVNLKFVKLDWQGVFRPFEIKTLRLNRKTGTIYEVNLLEE